MTLEEAVHKILERQGIDLETEDDMIADAARRGVADADPSEYLHFCEHLHLAYHPSPLGKMTTIHSIGTKTLWCRHGGGMTSADLNRLFNGFKSEFCKGCEQHCPRSESWEYSEKYYAEQLQDDDFQEFLSVL